MFKKTLLTTATLAVMSSAVMAEEMSVRQQAWEGIKSGFSTSVDAANDYVIDPVVGGAKGVGLGVATGASVAGSAIADGAVVIGGTIADGAIVAGGAIADGAVATGNGLAYTFNMSAGILEAGFVESKGAEKIGNGITSVALLPVMFTIDVLDLVWDGSKEVVKGAAIAVDFLESKGMPRGQTGPSGK